MCGITGFVDFKFLLGGETLTSMLNTLNHRGPDDQGAELFENEDARVGLSQKRLSIIDLSPTGRQPMKFENLNIIFNGEIYNYREIREELESLQYVFISSSDTEVILKAYHAWGIGCINKFIGMFSIVIYNVLNGEIILIRDRAGVKPLYWYNGEDCILFSSELKAFHKCPLFKAEIDINALGQYFKYGYIPAPYSIFKNSLKVRPGHYIIIDIKSRSIFEKCYWNVLDFYNKPKLKISFEEALESTKEKMISACNYRLVADVPVGVFLSGGYDSSTITALLQKYSGQTMKTFTIGFHEDKYNEAVFAKNIAQHLQTDHHEYYCSVDEAKTIIPTLPKIYDEPFGDSSAIPTILLSKIAVNQVKVALSADAGDEIFAGYGNYIYFHRQYQRMQSLPMPLRRALGSVVSSLRSVVRPAGHFFYNLDARLGKLPPLFNSSSPEEFNAVISQYFTDYEIRDLINAEVHHPFQTSFTDYVDSSTNDFIDTQLAIGYKTFLVDDVLTKVDRATMSVSLEGREPLLDHRIIEYVAQLPSNFKFYKGQTKHLLKEIAHQYIPKELMDRPKMGFSIPLEKWLKNDLAELLRFHLSTEEVERVGVLNSKTVNKILNDFLSGRKFNLNKIWFILMFQMWSDEWL